MKAENETVLEFKYRKVCKAKKLCAFEVPCKVLGLVDKTFPCEANIRGRGKTGQAVFKYLEPVGKRSGGGRSNTGTSKRKTKVKTT
jgi:hypothetical protein